jgi:hypothetical protein
MGAVGPPGVARNREGAGRWRSGGAGTVGVIRPPVSALKVTDSIVSGTTQALIEYPVIRGRIRFSGERA